MMESFFARYYTDLLQRIKEAVPEIRWVEQDYGQDTSRYRPSVDFPAVLIDFTDAAYENLAEGALTAELQISFRLIEATYSQSYSEAPEEVREQALSYYGLEQKLTEALHGWEPADGYTQPLMLERATTEKSRQEGLRIRVLRFSTAFEQFLME